jgi:hypothetical protein
LRQEDKEVDGFDLEQAEQRKRENELVEEDEEALHDLDGKPELARDDERTGIVTGAVNRILEREHIVVNDLDVTPRERRALDALKTAVEGRDQEINGFVFAEDRRALLEQALAVLQPDLAKLELTGGKAFEQLVHEVAELREQLDSLEASQEEVDARRHAPAKAETDDKDDDDKDDDDDKPRASTLTGPDRKEAPKPPSTLSGPERKDEPKPPSTLSGPDRKEEPKTPTTLGDPKEIAAAATPSWKRR